MVRSSASSVSLPADSGDGWIVGGIVVGAIGVIIVITVVVITTVLCRKGEQLHKMLVFHVYTGWF